MVFMTEVKVVRNENEFRGLTEEWNRLAAETDEHCIFLRHEWFDAAWCWSSGDSKLNILCVTQGGTLIGIFPLVFRRATLARIPVRLLEFLAIPDTQECAVLSAPENVNDVILALSQYLASKEIRWDIVHLVKLRVDSPVSRRLEAIAREVGSGFRLDDGGLNPGIGFDDDWESYYGRRSRRLKKGNNLIVNRLKRDGKNVVIHHYDSAAAVDAGEEEILKTLVRLSASSWKARSGSTLEKEGPGKFIDRLSRHAIRNSWFLAWVLTVDGQAAAMEYQLDYKGVVSGLRADYDPQFEQYSPGTLLNWRIIERLFETNTKQYWMGPGSNQYKLRWTEQEIALNNLYVYGKTLRGRAVRIVELFLRPAARRLLKVLPTKRRSRQ